MVKNDRLRVDRKEFDFDSHLVDKNRLSALDLIEGTNSGKEIDDCVVVFNSAMGNQGEGNVEVVCVDSFVALLRFSVGIDREDLRRDGSRVHGM